MNSQIVCILNPFVSVRPYFRTVSRLCLQVIELRGYYVDLPKLQFIDMDDYTFEGNPGDKQITIFHEPYNYKSMLIMKSWIDSSKKWIDLPSLISLTGACYNFYRIGSIILESNDM